MGYSLIAGIVTPDQIVTLLKALDAIANTPTDVRPGHAEYLSKSDLISLAQRAMSELPWPAEEISNG